MLSLAKTMMSKYKTLLAKMGEILLLQVAQIKFEIIV
jgi:hypothetical protein